MKILNIATTLLLGTSLCLGAELATKKALTLAAAKEIAAAAQAEAKKNSWNMVVVIVDEGGNLLYLERADETQIGSIDVAIAKAQGAVKFKRPTKAFEDAVAGGRTALLKVPGIFPVEGGLPLMADGKVIGAIGVSGATAQQDGQCAAVGAKVLGN